MILANELNKFPGTFTPRVSHDKLLETAIQFEASFLSEMLKSAGAGKTPAGFGGGVGEDQFSSLLLREQALHIAKTGSTGIAETIFEILKEKTHG